MVTKEYLLSVAASKALAKTEWCEEDNACLGYIDGYKQGDADRHKIDIEKACKWIMEHLQVPFTEDAESFVAADKVRMSIVDDFRKAMETEQ